MTSTDEQGPSAEHRRVAGRFTELVLATPAHAWDNPSPVEAWRARDVVGHLLEWFPGFLEAGSGVRLPAGPSAADDPAGAWQTHSDAVQALLDDPGTADLVLSDPH